MANRFYTILIISDQAEPVKRWVVPSWILKSAAFILTFVFLLGIMMVFDYWYVMNQIGENKELKFENRKLRQQVQIFQNKIFTIENTLERLKSFSTRLKVIMNLEGQEQPDLKGKIPDANANIISYDSLPKSMALTEDLLDPEKIELRKEYSRLEEQIQKVNDQAFQIEEWLQDQYEILYDKKSFLAALPTRQPAPGYFTSGFGIRRSPYGERIKMHEGIDIANRTGTEVRSPANGEVIFADSKAGYGLTIILNHGYGMETLYGHLQKFAVKKGDKVKRGTKIAYLGNTGRSTGPHVHYEVRVNGYPVDPMPYIFEN